MVNPIRIRPHVYGEACVIEKGKTRGDIRKRGGLEVRIFANKTNVDLLSGTESALRL